MAIKEWAAQDRPREKLITQGVRQLTDTELLTIVIGSGTHKHSAAELARDMLSKTGGLHQLSRLSYPRLSQLKGFGLARFACLHAGMEIGRRTMFSSDGLPGTRLENSRAAESYVKKSRYGLHREVFAGLFLVPRHNVLRFDVAMNKSFLMSVLQTLSRLHDDVASVADVELLLHQHKLEQVHASNELHDNV